MVPLCVALFGRAFDDDNDSCTRSSAVEEANWCWSLRQEVALGQRGTVTAK